jgi:hypothetical protein
MSDFDAVLDRRRDWNLQRRWLSSERDELICDHDRQLVRCPDCCRHEDGAAESIIERAEARTEVTRLKADLVAMAGEVARGGGPNGDCDGGFEAYHRPLEPDAQPRVCAVAGCSHTLSCMAEWCRKGACPVCPTAAAGMLGERVRVMEAVVALVRAHQCCDGDDARQTPEMARALAALDEDKPCR